jgi:hypothetical protein
VRFGVLTVLLIIALLAGCSGNIVPRTVWDRAVRDCGERGGPTGVRVDHVWRDGSYRYTAWCADGFVTSRLVRVEGQS